MNIKNIAIIAHVDHGKTTLVDAILDKGGEIKKSDVDSERIMDSNDQEKERGITIYSKNTSIVYNDTKINIVDTPGHADFGSEVERVLGAIDATLLIVDAYEGPMPQTKFVLQKSLSLNKKVLVVINKIDKPSANPDRVINEVFDLFVELGASDEQLDFPIIYTIARDGIAVKNLNDEKKDITPLLDFIIENVDDSYQNLEDDFYFQPVTLDYDNFLGRIAVGRVRSGVVKKGQQITVVKSNGERRNGKLNKIFTFQGLEKKEVETIESGDIVAITGIADIFVGETVSTNLEAKPLPSISVDPPALQMNFMVNDSPFAGKEGKFVTSRQIRDRLEREIETNVGLKIDFEESSESFKVYGRGEMHLAVLLEDMRREGYEIQVSQPEVITKEIDGKLHEPFENLVIMTPEEFAGSIIEILGKRKGEMTNMVTENEITRLEFSIPTRGLLGFRSDFIIMTKGEGTLYSSFDDFKPHCGKIEKRSVGSLISSETGKVTAYSLWNLQDRGAIFIKPNTEVYQGMIIGEHNQGNDLTVNPIKEKKLTNVRASGSDDAIKLTPPIIVTLERGLEYIKDDELLEITPSNIRIRKKLLSETDRKRAR